MPRLCILGRTTVDGRPVKNVKPLELVAVLAVAGGTMSRDGVLNRLYECEASASTVPTLAYRARKLGLAIEYDAYGRRYRLARPVSLDALDVLRLARAGRPQEALCLYAGECLPTSTSPFALALRLELESALVRAILAVDDDDLVSMGCQLLDNQELAQAAMSRRGEPIATVLSHSFLVGGDLL